MRGLVGLVGLSATAIPLGVVVIDIVQGSPSLGLTAAYAAASVVFVVVGWLIIERRPGNVIGALLLAFGSLFALYLPADSYLRLAPDVTYGVVSAILGAAFVAVVVVLGAVLAGFAEGATLAVAGSTLVAFALFQPVRRRVQDGVDRRFDRARIDADRTAGAFMDRMRDQTDLDAMTGDLRSTIDGALHPSTISVWVPGSRGASAPLSGRPGAAGG